MFVRVTTFVRFALSPTEPKVTLEGESFAAVTVTLCAVLVESAALVAVTMWVPATAGAVMRPAVEIVSAISVRMKRVGAKMCSYSCENGSHRRLSC